MLPHITHQKGYHYCMVMLPGRLEIIIIHGLETINPPGYTDDTRAFEHWSKKNSNAPTEKSLSKSQEPQILFLYHHSIIHVFFLGTISESRFSDRLIEEIWIDLDVFFPGHH